MRTEVVGDEEGTSNTIDAPSINWDSLDFDIMFDKLVAYKDEHGSANVPIDFAPDAQLSSWVSGLRRMKKSFDEVGPTKDDGATILTEAGTKTTTGNLQYLTTERIQRLESIGFDWSIVSSQPTSSSTSNKQTKSRTWEERLTELKDWRDTHGGTFNVPRTCSLGEWLHSQRQLYSKRDDKFMANKAPRMEAIGYVFDLRENNSVSWDDRFQQLVEFHEKHGTFDVPPPASGGDNLNEEMDEKYKFYKWVCRLHNEYRGTFVVYVYWTPF
jgi:hypothetical protein